MKVILFCLPLTDYLPPVIRCPDDVRVYNDPTEDGAADVTWPPPYTFDDLDPMVEITTNVTWGDNYFLIGVSTVSVTATDDAGNSRKCTFKVYVDGKYDGILHATKYWKSYNRVFHQ